MSATEEQKVSGYNPTTVNLQRIEAWLEALASETDAARHAEAFTAYLAAMAKFWRYSQRNSLLIWTQNPLATLVNSRKRWEALGYTVKKGAWQEAIGILCPHFKKVRDPQTGQESEILTHFTTGRVFDLTSVEAGPGAQPLTAPWQRLGGDHTALYRLLVATCGRLGVRVETRDDLPESVEGYSEGRGVIVLNGRSPQGNQAHTICHELSHELIHPREKRAEFTRQQVECQAESVNWCVLNALGITPANSPTYLALYGISADVLRQNIDAIARGVRLILSAIEAVTAATTRTEEAA